MSIDPTDTKQITGANKAAWDASADYHRNNPQWKQLKADICQPGFSCLDTTLTATLTALPVAGKSVVQIGCNNGREILSLASLGVKTCLGIDQSPAFIQQARDLADAAGADAQFLCADIYDLPQNTPRSFDTALTTIGVLNWMPDLPRFFAILSGLLKPGGAVVIYETHPFLEMMDPTVADPDRLTFSYFKRDPFIETDPIVYDGNYQGKVPPSYWFLHKISDILNAVIGAGLAIERLIEHPHSIREVDYDKYENQAAQLPLCFTLNARKS